MTLALRLVSTSLGMAVVVVGTIFGAHPYTIALGGGLIVGASMLHLGQMPALERIGLRPSRLSWIPFTGLGVGIVFQSGFLIFLSLSALLVVRLGMFALAPRSGGGRSPDPTTPSD